jgi:hypothetical protein
VVESLAAESVAHTLIDPWLLPSCVRLRGEEPRFKPVLPQGSSRASEPCSPPHRLGQAEYQSQARLVHHAPQDVGHGPTPSEEVVESYRPAGHIREHGQVLVQDNQTRITRADVRIGTRVNPQPLSISDRAFSPVWPWARSCGQRGNAVPGTGCRHEGHNGEDLPVQRVPARRWSA